MEHPLDTLDFDDDETLDNEVDLVRWLDSGAVVHNRQRHLAPKLQRESAEFFDKHFWYTLSRRPAPRAVWTRIAAPITL